MLSHTPSQAASHINVEALQVTSTSLMLGMWSVLMVLLVVAANQCIPNQATALRCILGCQLSASVEELASFRVVVAAHSKTAGGEQV